MKLSVIVMDQESAIFTSLFIWSWVKVTLEEASIYDFL